MKKFIRGNIVIVKNSKDFGAKDNNEKGIVLTCLSDKEIEFTYDPKSDSKFCVGLLDSGKTLSWVDESDMAFVDTGSEKEVKAFNVKFYPETDL